MKKASLKRILMGAGLFVPTLTMLGMASAQSGHYGGRGVSHSLLMGGLFSGLLSLLLLALLVLGIIYLVQLLRARGAFSALGSTQSPPSTPTSTSNDPDPALHILRERLAKGDIDPEDFEVRRQILLRKEGSSATGA